MKEIHKENIDNRSKDELYLTHTVYNVLKKKEILNKEAYSVKYTNNTNVQR